MVLPLTLIHCGKTNNIHIKEFYHPLLLIPLPSLLLTLKKTSLMRRLQAQTLPDATPPLCEIPPITKMAVIFEPMK